MLEIFNRFDSICGERSRVNISSLGNVRNLIGFDQVKGEGEQDV